MGRGQALSLGNLSLADTDTCQNTHADTDAGLKTFSDTDTYRIGIGKYIGIGSTLSKLLILFN